MQIVNIYVELDAFNLSLLLWNLSDMLDTARTCSSAGYVGLCTTVCCVRSVTSMYIVAGCSWRTIRVRLSLLVFTCRHP